MYITARIVTHCSSPHRHKTIHYPLAAGLFEFDFELVAFDFLDAAVAEFLVEDAHSHRQVVAAFVTEADGAGAGLDAGQESIRLGFVREPG